MTENPYSSPATSETSFPADSASHASWQSVTQPLREATGWARFLGIMLIIIGILYCLSIVGVIVGWLPIWLGILCLKLSDNLRNGTSAATKVGLEQLAKIIRIIGIATVFFLVLMVLYFIGIVFLIGFSATPVVAPAPALGP